MAFNERLKELRTGLNLTQKEFAQKIGLSAASVIAYERNEKKPSFDVLLSIAEQFDVSLDWLCRDKTDYEYKIERWSDFLYLIYPLLKNKRVPIYAKNIKDGNYSMIGLCFPKSLISPDSLGIDEPGIDGYVMCEPPKVRPEIHDQSDLAIWYDSFENPIYKFITTYEKMKKLLDTDSITEDLFNLWLDDEFRKNDKIIWHEQPPTVPDWLEEDNDNGND